MKYNITDEQREFLETMISFPRNGWFLTSTDYTDGPSETSLIKECLVRGTYTEEEKIILNNIVAYFKIWSVRYQMIQNGNHISKNTYEKLKKQTWE